MRRFGRKAESWGPDGSPQEQRKLDVISRGCLEENLGAEWKRRNSMGRMNGVSQERGQSGSARMAGTMLADCLELMLKSVASCL